ncbi:MAG: hypothetical protein JEZ11_25730 [Desulfobacterales bacterium]|nr:hypothetical protein [Desulfobacterales bacterium]
MVTSEGDRLQRVVVCTPNKEYGRADNRKEHNIGKLGDPGMAIEQHDRLKSRLKAFGAEVIDVPEMVGHPNSVFTRDASLCTPEGYINLRLGLATRRGEEAWMAEVLEGLKVPVVGQILAPGTVEGGDVVLAGKAAFIGRSVRTNKNGVEQLSSLLEAMGYEVRVIELPDTILHLDKVLMTLGPDRVLYCKDIISPKHIKGFDGVEISCGGNSTANIICLGDGEFIVNHANSMVAGRLETEEFVVHALDLGEFAKGMGGPNCLIMPVARGA